MDIYDAGPEGVMGRIIMVIDNPSVVTMDPMGNLSVSVMCVFKCWCHTHRFACRACFGVAVDDCWCWSWLVLGPVPA
jgi:hypothetical protein